MKAKPWEAKAVDLIYKDKDPVTVGVVPRDLLDIAAWLNTHIKLGPNEHAYVVTYDVILN